MRTDIYSFLGFSTLLCTMFVVRRFFSSASGFRPGIIYTTESSEKNAKHLANELVKSKFAACVQMKEVTSVYEWNGKVEEDKEIQLTIKCNLQQYDALESFIKSIHSYDTPQIIAVEVEKASLDYLQFMKSGTTRK
jgi:periplasmic divalent cation tolerance protein